MPDGSPTPQGRALPSAFAPFDPSSEAFALRGAGRRVRRLLARGLYGARARTLVEAARRDLRSLPLPECVRLRTAAAPAAPSRRGRLRALNLAILDRIWRDEEPGVCLLRCVALLGELPRHGLTATLVLGVARSETGAVAAHAWLESDGRILLEPDDVPPRFQVVARLPAGDPGAAPA